MLEMFGQATVLVQSGRVRHLNSAGIALLGSPAEQLSDLPLRALLGDTFELSQACDVLEVQVPWLAGATPAQVRCVDAAAEVYLIVLHRNARDSLSVPMVDFADAAAEGVLMADAVGGINDPLASLLMSLEEAADHAAGERDAEPEELGQLIFEAMQAAQRVADVVRGVLGAPRVPARTVPLDINELVERSARVVRRQRATLEIDTQCGVCAPVVAPRERLEQVLVHVLLTAPAPPGGACLTVRTVQQGEDVVVELCAGGVPGDQQRPFDRRYAVVTSLVQQMGGACEAQLDARSLRVWLRFGGGGGAGVQLAASRARRRTAPPRGQLRILVVDDEPSIHRALRRALREVGLVQAVSSGNAAIEMLEGGAQFDAVLCDVVMADGTGFDLANWLEGRGDPLKRRMILMTGLGERDNVSHPDVLTVSKPFDSTALRELVYQVGTRG